MVTAWTVGYAGRTPKDLVSILRDYGVQRLVDIRELPLTEVQGFSHSPLGRLLKEHGIVYDLRRELGAPQEARQRFQEDGDYEALCEAYLDALPNKAIEDLVAVCRQQPVAILSEDRSHERSLRRPLAARLRRHGLDVKHIQ